MLATATRAAQACDTFLAIGSSLTVQPAAGLVGLAAGAGASVIVVNASPTPYDAVADHVIRDPISEAVPRLVAAVAPAR